MKKRDVTGQIRVHFGTANTTESTTLEDQNPPSLPKHTHTHTDQAGFKIAVPGGLGRSAERSTTVHTYTSYIRLGTDLQLIDYCSCFPSFFFGSDFSLSLSSPPPMSQHETSCFDSFARADRAHKGKRDGIFVEPDAKEKKRKEKAGAGILQDFSLLSSNDMATCQSTD